MDEVNKMARQKEKSQTKKIRPALTPEAQENRMIALSMRLAEQQLLDGTASSQVITHFLKLGSSKEKEEREHRKKEMELLEAKTENSITISWTASEDNVGVVGYKVLVDGVEKANVTEGTACTLTGLEPGREYSILVIAYDAMGSQTSSEALTVSTLPASGEEPGQAPEVKPEEKPANDPASAGDKAVQTGDAADFSVWAAALLVSAGAVIAVRRKKKES